MCRSREGEIVAAVGMFETVTLSNPGARERTDNCEWLPPVGKWPQRATLLVCETFRALSASATRSRL